MLKFGFYRKHWKKVTIWKRKLTKYISGNVVPCYGCFITGQILNENLEWENVIILLDEEYNLDKQYRKIRERFLSNSYTLDLNPSINPHVAFDTQKDAREYYQTHKKLSYQDFIYYLNRRKARFERKSRLYSLMYKEGIGYVAI